MIHRLLRSLVVVGTTLSATAMVSRAARAAEVQAADVQTGSGQPLCLDVAGSGTARGTDIILYPCHGGRNQDFTFHRATGELRSSLGDVCVDVNGGGAWPGNRVQLWSCNGSNAQKLDYDRRSQHLTFRADPSLCLDIPGAGAAARLGRCGDSAAQRYSVSTPYGNRRFDELTFLTAHNAYANYEDARWISPNQSRGIGRALRDGVRGFMLDVHSFESGMARCILSFGADCYGRDVYLCHGNCGGVPGFQYALPRQPLAGALYTIIDFLDENPDELVTVFLEDYVGHDELRAALDGVPGLRDLLFDPYAWKVQQNGWPLARDLIDSNRRLLIISDRDDKRDLGVGHGPDFMVENYWSIGDLGNDYDCRSRWDHVALDRTEPGFQRLFVMNHYRNTPTVITAAIDNRYENLAERMNGYCVPAAQRKPNFIAVDFYEVGDAAGIAVEVDDSSAILFTHADYRGRAQLLVPGLHGTLDVGNDVVSSLKVALGTSVVLYEHGQLGGRSRRFTASAGWVGDDFNDQASSAAVYTDASELVQQSIFDGDAR